MTGKRWKRKVAWLTAVSALLAVGCSGQPFEYHSQNEIPEGPGIFSGKDGAFTLGGGDAQSEPDAEAAQAAEAAEATEFETFQRWKNDPRNAAEYQEFLEWRVWNANRDLQEHTQGQ
jgi:hypothetical protein